MIDLDLFDLVVELQNRLRTESEFDPSIDIWKEYVSYGPLVREMETGLFKISMERE